MKAILVFDEMPKRCGDCICYQCGFCLTNFGTVDMDDKPADWCPLKPMPQKQEYAVLSPTYRRGWNDCLEELEK